MKKEETFAEELSEKAETVSVVIGVDDIGRLIYTIRGHQVMLDADLALIYGYEVKNLNRQVKNNIKRFPEDFMFQLTKEELNDLRCNFSTANVNSKSRTLPYCFTEQGVYMLATVLRGELAEQQSVFIMRAFREMRHYIRQNGQFVTKEELKLLTERQDAADDKIKEIKKSIDKINENFALVHRIIINWLHLHLILRQQPLLLPGLFHRVCMSNGKLQVPC